MDVEEGTFSTSDTSTSLDKVLIEIDTDPLANQPTTPISLLATKKQRSFGNPNSIVTTLPVEQILGQVTKSSLKGSRVSFSQSNYSSEDEDDFSGRRHHFQKHGPQRTENVDNKSILKVKTISFIVVSLLS